MAKETVSRKLNFLDTPDWIIYIYIRFESFALEIYSPVEQTHLDKKRRAFVRNFR